MSCRCEIKWHKFGLSHDQPARFGTSQWQELEKVSIPFVLYRFIVFAYFWGFFIYDLMMDYTPDSRSYYMIYLTNWTYISALLDMEVQLASALLAAYRCHKGIKPLVPEWLYKTQWVIVNISHTMEPMVAVMFWAGLFPFQDAPLTYADVQLHLLTTLYTMADLMIHGTPRRYHHVIYPLCFGVSYLFFSVIYYLCGGLDPSGNTGIYPIVDWAEPGMSAGVAVAACAVTFLLHWLTWGVVRLRLHIYGRWHDRQVIVNIGFDPNGGGDIGGAAGRGSDANGGVDIGGAAGQGSGVGGERNLYVDEDIGDGGPVENAPMSRASTDGLVDIQKAFGNASLVVDSDDDDPRSSSHANGTHIA